MIKKELLSFKHQIPVSEINADALKKAIHNKKVLCSVNGVKVNNPGFYSIISNIFKSLDMMDNEENGSIIAFPKLIEEVLPGNRIYLSSVKVIDFSNYEVYGTGIGEKH